jgi:hypothetical protein
LDHPNHEPFCRQAVFQDERERVDADFELADEFGEAGSVGQCSKEERCDGLRTNAALRE